MQFARIVAYTQIPSHVNLRKATLHTHTQTHEIQRKLVSYLWERIKIAESSITVIYSLIGLICAMMYIWICNNISLLNFFVFWCVMMSYDEIVPFEPISLDQQKHLHINQSICLLTLRVAFCCDNQFEWYSLVWFKFTIEASKWLHCFKFYTSQHTPRKKNHYNDHH